MRLNFLGHNVITNSHFDNYTFDYLTFNVSTGSLTKNSLELFVAFALFLVSEVVSSLPFCFQFHPNILSLYSFLMYICTDGTDNGNGAYGCVPSFRTSRCSERTSSTPAAVLSPQIPSRTTTTTPVQRPLLLRLLLLWGLPQVQRQQLMPQQLFLPPKIARASSALCSMA